MSTTNFSKHVNTKKGVSVLTILSSSITTRNFLKMQKPGRNILLSYDKFVCDRVNELKTIIKVSKQRQCLRMEDNCLQLFKVCFLCFNLFVYSRQLTNVFCESRALRMTDRRRHFNHFSVHQSPTLS